MNMLRIEGLTKVFDKSIRAVDSLSLSVKKGTMVGFLGPNGAGKTTTIKILTNLMAPTSGSAYIDGVDISRHPKEALASVGAVVETPEFYPFLTANETLMLLGRIRGMTASETRRRGSELLTLLGLEDRMDSKVGTFSKGMKQRLALVQAILHQPKLLILDEPTSGLDPRGMVEMREILRSLKDNGYTIFMSSHLLPEVQETCDYVAMIDSGRLLLHKSVDEISAMVNSKRIEIVLAETPSDEVMRRISVLNGVSDVQMASPLKLSIGYEGDAKDRDMLLRELLASGLKVASFSPHGLALENVYLEMVKGSG